MAESKENSEIGAIALESRLTEEAGYSDDSTTKPIANEKINTRKRRHGESTESRYSSKKNYANYLGLLKGLTNNYIERK